MREGTDDNNFSDVIWSEPVARSLGVKEQFTYIDRIPGTTGKTPTTKMVESIMALIKEHPRDVPEAWLGWVEGGKNRAAKVQKTKSHLFWQGMEIMRKGEMLTNKAGQLQPQFPTLGMGAVSLQMSFEELGNTRIENYNGPMPENITADDPASRAQKDQIYAQMFALGDFCSIEHGRIISIFQAKASGKFTMNHYSLRLLQEFPLTSIAEQIKAMWRPWDQLLRYFTVEEHMQMLCRAFPPEAVDYVFGGSDLRDLMPANFKGTWNTLKAALSGAWAPGTGQGMVAPQGAPMGPTGAPMPGQQQFVPAPQQVPQAPAAQMPAAPAQQPPQIPQAPQPPAPQVPVQGMQVPQAPAPQVPQAPAPQTAPAQMPAQVPQAPAQAPQAPQVPQAPAAAPQAPAAAPQAPQAPAQQVGGMAVNLSGAPVEGAQPPQSPPIMQSQGFASPPEFAQTAGAPAPTAPQGAVQQPNVPAQPAQATPPSSEPAVDNAELQSQLNALKASRDQSSEGNS